MLKLRRTVSLVLLGGLCALASMAQQPLTSDEVAYLVDSGLTFNRESERSVIFSETITVEDATWLRLYFSEADLSGAPENGQAAAVRITSLADGAVQTLDAKSMEQWQRSSAYFNGDAVRVELIADPGAAPSRIRIHELDAGRLDPATADRSICGALDDRVLSADPRVARIMPVGCTTWLINDAQSCFLTAGHCNNGNLSVVQFNVPLSNSNGSVNHPGPEDQYPADPSSVQFANGGVGNDYAYYGTFPNSQTEMTPFEVQGQTFVLGTPPLVPGGETIRITGYGSVDGTQGTPQTWNQVQHTHNGPIVGASMSSLQYAVDTTGGDSGSPVINHLTDEAIGIHTHAGCSAGGGANNGTSLNLAALQNVLAAPMGVCIDGPPLLRVTLDNVLPTLMPPAGMDISIIATDRDADPVSLASATLFYDDGSGEQSVPMLQPALRGLPDGMYVGTLPALTCGQDVTFRVEAEDQGGTVVHHPFSADNTLSNTYRRPVAFGTDETFRDDFETDQGWTVGDDPALGAGTWERGIPAGYGLRGDPPWDADTSGSAYLTFNSGGNTDVDAGATRLTSPTLDATGSDPHIHYWRWWDDAGTSDDVFTVEVSDDNGASWTTLETVGPTVTGEWVYRSFRISDFVTLTDQFKIRFTASDLGDVSLIEAGVDGVSLSNGPSGLLCDLIFADGFELGDTSSWSN